MAWSEVANRLYETALRLFGEGNYSACFLVACTGVEGFVRRANEGWLEEKLGNLGSAKVLDELDRIRSEVLAGVKDVEEEEARLALDVLEALLGGIRSSGEVVIGVNVIDIALSLCLAGLAVSFFFGSFPLWFDVLRIPLLAVLGVTLFSRFRGR